MSKLKKRRLRVTFVAVSTVEIYTETEDDYEDDVRGCIDPSVLTDDEIRRTRYYADNYPDWQVGRIERVGKASAKPVVNASCGGGREDQLLALAKPRKKICRKPYTSRRDKRYG